MRGTCSSMISLLIWCVVATGCSVNPATLPDPYTTGDLSLLADERFAPANARTGVWMPWKFVSSASEGIYFLDHYDKSKIPVLFIHGLYGSPRDFRYLIQHLDRRHFQPWLYYYASGADLNDVTERLLQEMEALCSYYEIPSIAVVAHSMGGLIARNVLLRASRLHSMVPVFITLSTPWDGHRGAALGARVWPRAVAAWHDLATRSSYIESLFETSAHSTRRLPDGIDHYLFASLGPPKKRGVNSSDGVVSVASQLRDEAWMDSHRIYRFDETHVGILNSTSVANSVNRTLATVLPHTPHTE